ncbi:phage tail protein, partial [Salmonella enterica]
MSENNYGALMLKSALDISVDVTKITSPGIYPVIHGNTSVPDASSGLLKVSLTPSKPQITFQKENSSVIYSFVNGNWEKPTATDVDALAKSQNGGDIPDKKQFARTIGAVTSTTITLGESGWFKIATVVMPQATSTAVIKLYGGAGFNAGSPEQAAISELVLRAGNGSPVGITATLWRRSPAAANEVAWVNTSGDTYDIYINIGQHAYWLIAQYDYTGNANVTLYSTPEYSSVQPGNSTSGQTYTIYSSLMKPTAGDVGALPITGGQLNGPLSIGTDNALGGNSIVLGDNDTGFKQNGDGILDTYANSQHTVRVAPGEMMVLGAIRAGKEKKLSLTSNNNSTMTATFNLWGDANRPTVIELDDDQGWHLYSQRNPDGSIVFTVNGD